ncbi:MAG: phosphopyruvate hydratase, partial [Bifidobacterium sp.]|nr:phosphopyruvate hydratase [Bifidobacterium sp.]
AIDLGAANSLLVKLNQIGSVTETLDAIELATANGYPPMVSHRPGDTPNTPTSDRAVEKNTGQIKPGAPARGERTAKYTRLLETEEELAPTAQSAGYSASRACKKYIAE